MLATNFSIRQNERKPLHILVEATDNHPGNICTNIVNRLL